MVSTKHGAVQNGKAGDCQEGEFCLWMSWIRAWYCIMLANAFSFLFLEITGVCPQFLSFIALKPPYQSGNSFQKTQCQGPFYGSQRTKCKEKQASEQASQSYISVMEKSHHVKVQK